MTGPAQPAGALGRRCGGVGAEAGAGERAVCGAEIATAYVDDHNWEESRGLERRWAHAARIAPLLFSTRWEGLYSTVNIARREVSVSCALLYTSSSIMYVNNLRRLLSATYKHSRFSFFSFSVFDILQLL